MWGVIPIVKNNSITNDPSESNYSIPHHTIKDYHVHAEDNSEDKLSDICQFPVYDNAQERTENNLLKKDNSDIFTFGMPVKNPSTLNDRDLLKIGMNVCHSLTILDNQLTGDPLDVKVKKFR